jgi:hypothetical protein
MVVRAVWHCQDIETVGTFENYHILREQQNHAAKEEQFSAPLHDHPVEAVGIE